jgi:simple sugar transport system permease protein
LLRATAWPGPLVLGLALAFGSLLGVANGLLIGALVLAPIVATLVLYTSGRGLAQVWTDGQIVPFTVASGQALARAPIAGLPASLWIAGLAVAVVGWLVRRTVVGPSIEALGDNPRAAWLAGVPRVRVLCFAYGATGTLAALAGWIACADIRAADPANLGLFLELDAILAVVLGGTRLGGGRMNLLGAVLGAVLLQALSSALIAAGAGYAAALTVKAGSVLVLSVAFSARRSRRAQ